jgi:hypothetical protein
MYNIIIIIEYHYRLENLENNIHCLYWFYKQLFAYFAETKNPLILLKDTYMQIYTYTYIYMHMYMDVCLIYIKPKDI